MTSAGRQRGFSLMELLVTLLVLGTGMLGMTALQGKTLRNSQQAQLHSSALEVAREITERLRANRSYALTHGNHYQTETGSETDTIFIDCTHNSCAPDELARYDQHQWLSAIQALPKGRASIRIDIDRQLAEVSVTWEGTESTSTAKSCSTTAQTTCVQLQSRL